ncbi:hypothetical protein QL285_033178 [Trifolium repens]|nr:hypothetical protein QL285_033178 [Trifolium repens]
MHYIFQYNGTPAFLQATTIFLVCSTPDLLPHKITNSPDIIYSSHFVSCFITPSELTSYYWSQTIYYVQVSHHLLLGHHLPQLLPPIIRTFSNDCFLIAPSLRSKRWNFQSPL